MPRVIASAANILKLVVVAHSIVVGATYLISECLIPTDGSSVIVAGGCELRARTAYWYLGPIHDVENYATGTSTVRYRINATREIT